MTELEKRHRVALARELTAIAGVPLRDRYGFAASDEDVQFCIDAVFRHPDDSEAGIAIGYANARGDVELAEGSDTPLSEETELRVVAALRPLAEDRRAAAGRSLT